MGAEEKAGVILTSITWGGTPFLVPLGFELFEEIDNVEIPVGGVVGPSGQGIVRKRIVAEVSWAGNTAPYATYNGATPAPATLVCTIRAKDTTSRTITVSSMVPMDRGFTDQRVPFAYRQKFVYEGDYSSDPVSFG